MRRVRLIGIGIVLAFLGALFGLQGLNVVHGSSMSGQTFWAVAGPIIFLLGLSLIGVGARRASR